MTYWITSNSHVWWYAKYGMYPDGPLSLNDLLHDYTIHVYTQG